MNHEIGTMTPTGLEALVHAVELGEDVIITRHGKAVARLIRAAPETDHERAVAAMASIREIRAATTLGPDLTLRELIDDGRH